MLCDYHLHSAFSGDSKQSLASICEQAIEKGIEEIAITDHEDRSWPENNPKFVINDFTHYFQSIEFCRQTYGHALQIRTGLEIGLHPKRMAEYASLLKDLPFDFIIGSLHEIDNYPVHHPAFYAGKSKLELYQTYYETLRTFIQPDACFDVVGHLDYIRRYIPFPYQPEDLTLAQDSVKALLMDIIQAGIGIECNTSGFQHQSGEPLPSLATLKSYADLGGKIITIGSDAHQPKNVGFGIEKAHAVLRECGLTHYMRFNKRVCVKEALQS